MQCMLRPPERIFLTSDLQLFYSAAIDSFVYNINSINSIPQLDTL